MRLLLPLLGGLVAGRALVWRRPMLDLRGCSAVVIGGSRGLGLAIARELVREGARITLLARTSDDLAAALSELEAMGGDVFTLRCDITDRTDLQSAIGAAEAARDGIDLLINDAGLIQ